MKLTLLIFILLCINTTYSQKESDSIACYFEKNGVIEISYLKSDVGSTNSTVGIWVKNKSSYSIKNSFTLELHIEHITSDENDIELSTRYIAISKEELNERDSLRKEIIFKVKNKEVSESKLFSLAIKIVNSELSILDSEIKAIISTKADKVEFEKEVKDGSTEIGQLILTSYVVKPYVKRNKGVILLSDHGIKSRDERFIRKYQLTSIRKEKKADTSYLLFSSDFIYRKVDYSKYETETDVKKKSLLIENIEEDIEFKGVKKSDRIKCKKKSETKTIVKYDEVCGNSQDLKIDSTFINISNGRISRIIVSLSNDGGFYENKGPISLTNYRRKRYYRLNYSGPTKEYQGTFIIIKDFLDYRSTSSRSYFPSDVKITFNSDNKKQKLHAANSLKYYFDARVYTDTKGLGGENNGLVQTDINGRFLLNSNNVGRSYFSWAQFLRIGLSFSKFDSKYDTLKMESYMNRTDADLLNLVRSSNTSFFLEMDVFRVSRVHDGYLSAGHYLHYTKVFAKKDTNTASVSEIKRIFTPSFYAVLGVSIFATKRIKSEFRLPAHLVYSVDQPFREYSRKTQLFLAPEIEITIKLKKNVQKDEVSGTNLFGRFRYFDEVNSRGTGFWQIQTGINVSLSEIFKSEGD